MSRLAVLFIILIFCFVSCGKSANARRAPDDVVAQCILKRYYVRSRSDLTMNSSTTESGLEETSWNPMRDFVGALFSSLIEGVICLPWKTKVVVYPDGKDAYRQRLYWGENHLYFPKASLKENGLYPMRIVVTGDRQLDHVFSFRIDSDGRLVMGSD